MQKVRGMQDVWGEQAQSFEVIYDIARKCAEKSGFITCQTPILEHASLFLRNLGEESDVVAKEIYKFEDRGGDMLALRPEFTAGVVRAFVENNMAAKCRDICRVFSYGALFRYDRPQKGRYRQFNQVNFESFMNGSYAEDAEIILLARDFLRGLGLEGKFELELNFLGNREVLANYGSVLQEYFARYEQELSVLSRERLSKNPLRILDSKDEADKKIAEGAPKISSLFGAEERARFEKTCDLLAKLGVSFRVNEGIVRGLDYYTGIVFEFTTSLLGAQSTILGGGRYDELISQMAEVSAKTPAIGFAAGVERLSLLLESATQKRPALFILPLREDSLEYSMNLARKLRENGVISIVNSRFDLGLGKRIERVSKEDFEASMVIIGESERLEGRFKLKHLASGEEKNVDLNGLILCLESR